MSLTPGHIEKFKILYKQQFGIDLSTEEATDKATRLLQLVKHIYKPMTQEEYATVSAELEELRQSA